MTSSHRTGPQGGRQVDQVRGQGVVHHGTSSHPGGGFALWRVQWGDHGLCSQGCRATETWTEVCPLLADGVRNYMTKFLDNQWLADRDIIQLEERETQWWANEKVSSLELSAPFSVQPTVTVEQAV